MLIRCGTSLSLFVIMPGNWGSIYLKEEFDTNTINRPKRENKWHRVIREAQNIFVKRE